MRKLLLCSLLLAVALNAFGHGGEVHTYMGTVTTLHKDGSFGMKKTDGQTIHVEVSKVTKYQHADGHAARPTEVEAGKRVVVTLSRDGKTASTIKLAAVKRPQSK